MIENEKYKLKTADHHSTFYAKMDSGYDPDVVEFLQGDETTDGNSMRTESYVLGITNIISAQDVFNAERVTTSDSDQIIFSVGMEK
jgi:hypothetical protein